MSTCINTTYSTNTLQRVSELLQKSDHISVVVWLLKELFMKWETTKETNSPLRPSKSKEKGRLTATTLWRPGASLNSYTEIG